MRSIGTLHSLLAFILGGLTVILLTTLETQRRQGESIRQRSLTLLSSTENEQEAQRQEGTISHSIYAIDAYRSEQHLIVPSAFHCQVGIEISSGVKPVQDAMRMAIEDMEAQQLVFIMLNGENEGIFFRYAVAPDIDETPTCLKELGHIAGTILGVQPSWLEQGVRFMNQSGSSVTTNRAIRIGQQRMLHLLLDSQVWMYPGIAVGHQYRLPHGIQLTTLSLHPRIFSIQSTLLHPTFPTQPTEQLQKQWAKHSPQWMRREVIQTIKEDQRLRKTKPWESSDDATGQSHSNNLIVFNASNVNIRRMYVETLSALRVPNRHFVMFPAIERLRARRIGFHPLQERDEEKQRLETILEKSFALQSNARILEAFNAWIAWCKTRLDALGARAPNGYQVGQPLYPRMNSSDFQHALLKAFLEYEKDNDVFKSAEDMKWKQLIIQGMKEEPTSLCMEKILLAKPYLFPLIMRSWEEKGQMYELFYPWHHEFLMKTSWYSMVKKNGYEYYRHWYEWLRNQFVGPNRMNATEELEQRLNPWSMDSDSFKEQFIQWIFADYSKNMLSSMVTKNVQLLLLQPISTAATNELSKFHFVSRDFIELGIKSYERRAKWFNSKSHSNMALYIMPAFIPAYENHQLGSVLYFAGSPLTKFIFPNAASAGNATYSEEDACVNDGLMIEASDTHGILYYTKLPNGKEDASSLLGFCSRSTMQTDYLIRMDLWTQESTNQQKL